MESRKKGFVTYLPNRKKLREGTSGCWGEGIVWDGHAHTAIFKMDNQQGLTVGPGKSAQCYVSA